jgi:hypothetical protein
VLLPCSTLSGYVVNITGGVVCWSWRICLLLLGNGDELAGSLLTLLADLGTSIHVHKQVHVQVYEINARSINAR